MYGASVGGRFGTSVGRGAFFRRPRLTANRNKPLSAVCLKCHNRVMGPVPARYAATVLSRIRETGVRGPMARAEGTKGLFGDEVLVAQRPAEGHIARNQVVDIHNRPSRLKSPTVRSAGTLTLA